MDDRQHLERALSNASTPQLTRAELVWPQIWSAEYYQSLKCGLNSAASAQAATRAADEAVTSLEAVLEARAEKYRQERDARWAELSADRAAQSARVEGFWAESDEASVEDRTPVEPSSTALKITNFGRKGCDK